MTFGTTKLERSGCGCRFCRCIPSTREIYGSLKTVPPAGTLSPAVPAVDWSVLAPLSTLYGQRRGDFPRSTRLNCIKKLRMVTRCRLQTWLLCSSSRWNNKSSTYRPQPPIWVNPGCKPFLKTREMYLVSPRDAMFAGSRSVRCAMMRSTVPLSVGREQYHRHNREVRFGQKYAISVVDENQELWAVAIVSASKRQGTQWRRLRWRSAQGMHPTRSIY
jgi:hypothetical protein